MGQPQMPPPEIIQSKKVGARLRGMMGWRAKI
jgi:hypothetical protein